MKDWLTAGCFASTVACKKIFVAYVICAFKNVCSSYVAAVY